MANLRSLFLKVAPMITPVDPRFLKEAQLYHLRFTCEVCAHFDVDSERCGNGYPNGEHRSQALGSATQIVFCKDFELA